MLMLTSLAIGLSLLSVMAVAFGGEAAICPEPAPPACENARLELAKAQAEVRAAADRKALWTTAVSALKTAQGAFERGDYPAATLAAHAAVEQARLGVAQTQYPLFPPLNPGGSR
jgi:predicted S18 family serine protease